MDNLYDICLESVMMDAYCTEGFKDTLKNAGKAVGKGIVATIDFFINVARQMINVFANIFRKIRGKETKTIEDKNIVRDFLSKSARIISVRNKAVKAVDPNSSPMVLDSKSEKDVNDSINKTKKALDDLNKVGTQIDDNTKEAQDLVKDINNIATDIKKTMPNESDVFDRISDYEKTIADAKKDIDETRRGMAQDRQRFREFLANSKKRTGIN